MFSITNILILVFVVACVIAVGCFMYDLGYKRGVSDGTVDPRDPKTGRYVKRKK